MATITLIQPLKLSQQGSRRITGQATGNAYVVLPNGVVTVDTRDAPQLQAHGWVDAYPGSGGGSAPTSGVATIDFGAFPGTPTATATVVAADAGDPNAVLDAWIVAIATADHTADEHAVDPPLVSAQADGLGNIIITGEPSGRDLFVPPGVGPGQAGLSQMPLGQIQLMPVGKYSVGWAFSP